MKINLKKLGSSVMALAMIATLSPVTGSLVSADETETTSTAVETEETKVPEETKETRETTAETAEETEAPKETAAPTETEAPKETAKPAETPKETQKPVTEKAKEPGKTTSRKAKDGPAQVTRQISATIKDDGTLVWKDMLPESSEDVDDPSDSWISYYVYANGVKIAVVLPTVNDDTKELSVDLKATIDSYIKTGELNKAADNKYQIWIIAEQEYTWIFASWSGEFTYESQAKQTKKLGAISASIDSNGNLKWKTYKDIEEYFIYINEYYLWIDSNKRSIPLKKEIDFLIKAGFIKKADTYNIRIVGYDIIDPAAKWEGSFTYASEAVPGGTVGKIEGLELKNGVLTWNAYPDTVAYLIGVYNGSKRLNYTYVRTNKADINNYIANYIYDSDMDLSTIRFTIKVSAMEFSSGDAPGINELEQIPVAVGTYDDYLLEKAPNPLSVTGKKATVKKKKLRKKKQTVAASKVFAGLNTGRGSFVFTKLSGNKNIKISKSSGKITIKKNGLKKKKTYKVKVRVLAKGNVGYNASAPKTVTIRIKLK